MSSPTRGARALRMLVLFCWTATVVLVMQIWVGQSTIYRPEVAGRVQEAHDAIVANRPPAGGTWTNVGLNSTNIRVGVVFLAESVHEASGVAVPTVYRLVDTVALFAGMLLLQFFLLQLAPAPYAVIATLGFAALLPLTYQLFYFHPWDRVSFVAWIVLLLALLRRNLVAFGLLLPLAVAIKFDVIVLPGLVFLLLAPVPPRFKELLRATTITGALFVVSFGTYWALKWARPGGFEPVDTAPLLMRNLGVLRDMHLGYPPLLGFGVLALLAAVGFRRADRFARACAIFAMPVLLLFVTRSNFAEFRAEVPVFLLLLPAALAGLRLLLEPEPETARIT